MQTFLLRGVQCGNQVPKKWNSLLHSAVQNHQYPSCCSTLPARCGANAWSLWSQSLILTGE